MLLALTDSGATWGIEGPVFLAVFAVCGVLALAVAFFARRVGAAGAEAVGGLSHTELAYLVGGPSRAVAASLALLRPAGSVDGGPGARVIATGAAPAGASALDVAVLDAALPGIRVADLPRRTWVARELAAVRASLEGRGQLLDDAARLRIRLAAAPAALLWAVGVVRAFAGSANGRPFGFLVAALVVLGLGTLGLALSVPVRTRAGDRSVTDAAARHRMLHPSQKPSYADHGTDSAALAVALFGGTALMVLDPEFAAESEVHRHAGQDTGSWGAAWISSGGGSSSSSSSSSSSCSSSSCSGSSSSSCGGGGGGGCGG
ncbi:hypothetical protein GCM10022221_16170 [Actinocorallia aurea]